MRNYAGETGKPGGVYVTSVEPGQPAAKAGLQAGDIITAIGDHDIDQNGNYVDPLYGKTRVQQPAHRRKPTSAIRSRFTSSARASRCTLNVKLEHRAEEDYVVPPYNIDDPPSYYVLGGLIFQELSRQYLKEWGANWQKDAPQDFVYLDRFQSELFPEGNRRVVILSQVLPANSTIGYDDFSYLVVKKVNGKDINSLGDLAEAVKTPINGFHVIETEDDPKQLELDAARSRGGSRRLAEKLRSAGAAAAAVSASGRPLFGAIFDWDGVIIDSAGLHEQSWRRLAQELGKTIAPDSFIRGFGMKSARIIEEIHGWAKEPAEIARLTNRKEALYREIVARSEIAPLPGVVAWLERLHAADVPCAVASSTQRLNIDAVLDRIGLKAAFREIVSAEDVVQGKPNPEVFQKAAARLGVAAERCVVFEDAHVGIEAAHAARMKVVAVATTHPVEQLTAADLVVRRLDELTVEQVARL